MAGSLKHASIIERLWSTDRGLTLLLLVLIVVIFVVHPLGQLGVAGRLLTGLCFSFLLISGVGAVAKNARTTAFVGCLVLATLSARWLRWWLGGESLAELNALFAALFCTTMAAVVLAQVFREGPITVHRIEGAVAVYLLLGLAWAFAYMLIDVQWPNAFNPPSSHPSVDDDLTSRFVYFSFVTLTTVGYGDITAVHPVARSLVIIETLTGQLFPAILLARLVSMELLHRHVGEDQQR